LLLFVSRTFGWPCDNCTSGLIAHRTSFHSYADQVGKPASTPPSAILIQAMSSHLTDVPLPPIASPPRSRHARAHSITEHSSFAKHHRPHVHRHHVRRKSKDKGKDWDKDKGKDDKLMQVPSFTLQPSHSLTNVETGASKSENPTPAHSQNASRRTSLLGLNAEQDSSLPSWRAEMKGSKEVELIEEKRIGLLRATLVSPCI
jgi:hypothetical protein